MKSFGKLLRKMRGQHSLRDFAAERNLDYRLLAAIEAGKTLPDSITARWIVREGFDLDASEAARLVLGIELYDLGLRDNELRQLVMDVIEKSAPAAISKELRELYRSYSDGRSDAD